MIKSYELPISPNYVSNWGIKEAIREILQNAIDSDSKGFKKVISYDEQREMLTIQNEGARLSKSSLVLGFSNKSDIDGMIGKFGEGYKLALVVLLRKGLGVDIYNGNEIWTPSFKKSEKYETQILNIDIEDNEHPIDAVEFTIYGVNKTLYESLLDYFPCIEDNFGEIVESNNGQILLDKRFKGKMFVEGLYIQKDDNFAYGYNFNSNAVELDRDRKAINYYELRSLTAESIVTAENCHPEIFKAISDSCIDARDIKDVLDEASETFLEEYRDIFYEKNNLEENTLVATESVMKQLEQMDIDVPVVKGTEIESYLIAKANDKLGIIEEAKEELEKKDDKEDAFDRLIGSNYAKLLNWLYINKKYLPKKSQNSFLNIVEYLKTYNYNLIKESITEDCDFSNESLEDIKEEYLNG